MPDSEVESRALGLIGGIGLTEVHVYAQRPAPDGKFSGCPHVHAVTDEGYFVLKGTGAVEFHDTINGMRVVALAPGQYVHFPPLVMHRLISDGDLVILGIMGNAGLAERGEARIYFGSEVDLDPSLFQELVSLPKRMGLEGALRRRDVAVSGYQQLLKLWEQDRPGYFAELRRFISLHCRIMQSQAQVFEEQVESGPQAWAIETRRRINLLPAVADVSPDVFVNKPGSESALGMCGMLRPILSLEKI